MVYFEPQDILCATIGGALIAISSTLNLYTYGKITGVSGLLNQLLGFDPQNVEFQKALGFINGLCLIMFPFYKKNYMNIDGNIVKMYDNYSINTQPEYYVIIAGLLVGFGTKLGNGCTSGHGVCGLPRLSIRSFVAVGCFMTTGVLTSTFMVNKRYLNGFSTQIALEVGEYFQVFLICALNVLFIFYLFVKQRKFMQEMLISFVFGIIFGFGLMLSGMCSQQKVKAFLTIDNNWDPSLMFVMGSACAVNLISFQYLLRTNYIPLYCASSPKFANNTIDSKLIIGSSLFGVGWGLCGICPGPGLISMFKSVSALVLMICVRIGQLLGQVYIDKTAIKQVKIDKA